MTTSVTVEIPLTPAIHLEFMRQDLLAPLEAVVGLGENLLLICQEQDERPAGYIADLHRLRVAARGLYEKLRPRLRRGDGPVGHSLGDVRHELGNDLNSIKGICQLLLLDEEEFFGRQTPSLEQILHYSRICEDRLLKSRGSEVAAPRSSGVPVSGARPRAATAVMTAKILVVDDSAESRDVLAQLLRRMGHNVVAVPNAALAFEKLATLDFDVILSDLLMPDVSGFEFIQQLKADERYRHLPVIVVSGLDQTQDVVEAIQLGAEDHLAKPVDQTMLQARLNACLERCRLREREFAQFFPDEVARRFARRPDSLKQGRDVEVTVLFCDIRRFSRISENLSPARTLEWMNSVMDVLAECILDHGGTIVNFVGDEVLAMWGAPDPTDDHAQRAAHAALAIRRALPRVNQQWEAVLGQAVDLGIGLHTGVACVGNTGCARKFQFGALGATVNLGSRVQGATKYLRCPILATSYTARKLDGISARRICKIRVTNIAEPIEVFELCEHAADLDRAARLSSLYEQALVDFEQGRFESACATLGALLAEFPADGPALLLMSRAIAHSLDLSGHFDAIWELPGK